MMKRLLPGEIMTDKRKNLRCRDIARSWWNLQVFLNHSVTYLSRGNDLDLDDLVLKPGATSLAAGLVPAVVFWVLMELTSPNICNPGRHYGLVTKPTSMPIMSHVCMHAALSFLYGCLAHMRTETVISSWTSEVQCHGYSSMLIAAILSAACVHFKCSTFVNTSSSSYKLN